MSPLKLDVLYGAIAVPAVASVAIILRFYARLTKTAIGVDDWTILLAMVG